MKDIEEAILFLPGLFVYQKEVRLIQKHILSGTECLLLGIHVYTYLYIGHLFNSGKLI